MILRSYVAVGSLIGSIGTLSSNGVKLPIVSIGLRQIVVGLVGVIASAGVVVGRVCWFNVSIEGVSRFL